MLKVLKNPQLFYYKSFPLKQKIEYSYLPQEAPALSIPTLDKKNRKIVKISGYA